MGRKARMNRRKFGNSYYTRVATSLPKRLAQIEAAKIRRSGMNARVTPNAQSYDVYMGKPKRKKCVK